jgi:hypothetical protein
MKRQRYLYALITIVIILIAGFVLLNISKSSAHQIPKAIKSQLSFPVLFLNKPVGALSLVEGSIKYSDQPGGSKVFSYIVSANGNRITISEQAYPEILIYDKLANSINPYSEVGTLYGKVSLGRPKNSGGKQAAVLKYADSTLIFAQPSKDLSDDKWQQLFNSLNSVK